MKYTEDDIGWNFIHRNFEPHEIEAASQGPVEEGGLMQLIFGNSSSLFHQSVRTAFNTFLGHIDASVMCLPACQNALTPAKVKQFVQKLKLPLTFTHWFEMEAAKYQFLAILSRMSILARLRQTFAPGIQI